MMTDSTVPHLPVDSTVVPGTALAGFGLHTTTCLTVQYSPVPKILEFQVH
jgi:hypothetical protein